MSEFDSPETSLIPFSKSNTALSGGTVLKADVGVIPIWVGRRTLDEEDDTHRFEFALETEGRQFDIHSLFLIRDIDKMEGDPYPALNQVDIDIRREFVLTERPLAIFVITSPIVAEYPWSQRIPEGLIKARREHSPGQTFVYKVIMGAGVGFSNAGSQDPEGHFSKNEMRAYELGGVYLPYNTDYPSVSLRRLVEFMNRVIGVDLPRLEFPDYTLDDLRKMAWNIHREDFNVFYPRQGAIPKYPIVDGKPVFPF